MKKAVCVLLSASWFLSIAITWTLASKFSQTKSTENPSVLSDLNKSTIDESNPGSSSKNNSHQTRISIPRKPIVNRSPDILLTELEDLIGVEKKTPEIYDFLKMYKFVQQCSTEEIKDLLDSFNEKRGGCILFSAIAILSIAENSPDDAVTLFQDYSSLFGEGESSIAFIDGDIIDVVLSNDPYKALNILRNDKHGSFTSNNYETVFRKLSGIDCNSAIIELSNLETRSSRNQAINGIAVSLKTSEDFLNFIEQVDISKEHNYAIEGIFDNWAAISPKDALHWAKNLNINNSKTTSQIYQVWLRDEPQKAADWIMSNEDDKKKSYSELIKTGQNNLELREWLKQQPDSDEKEAAYLTRILNSKDDPRSKIEFLKDVRSQGERKNAVKTIYKDLVEKIKQEPHNRRFYSKLSAKFLRSNNDLSDEEKRHLKNKTAEDVKNSLLRGLN